MIPKLKLIRSSNPDIAHLQDSISTVIDAFSSKQIIDGTLIENITLTISTPLTINHGLGYAPRGWIVCKKNAGADVWETASTIPSKTLILNASATVTISIWVF